MSKDFKNEYENLLDSEIPDLWSRIEPQLHEKEKIKPKKKIRRLYAYSGVAAACLCLAIAIPVIIRTMNDSSKRNDAEMQIYAEDTSGMVDAAAPMEENRYTAEDKADSSFMDGMDAGESADCEADDSAMYDSTNGADDGTECIIAEGAEDDAEYDSTENSESSTGSSDANEEESIGAAKEALRLPNDNGDSMEIEGLVVSVSVEDELVVYEITVTTVNGQRFSGVKQAYPILAAVSLDADDSLREQIQEGDNADIRAKIRWDEAINRYRILEIL